MSANRWIPLASALAILGTSPASAQHTFRYSFGSDDLTAPRDVAAYAPTETTGHVFVLDSVGDLLRYDGNGQTNSATWLFSPCGGSYAGASSIAVNDVPSHCNNGQLYMTQGSRLRVLNADGADGMEHLVASPTYGALSNLVAVAVDADANVWVADATIPLIARLDAAHFFSNVPCTRLPHDTDLEFVYAGSGVLADLSVDQSGLVHVVDDFGDYQVFDTSGAPVSGATPFATLRGVSALDPRLDGVTTGSHVAHVDVDDGVDGFFGSGELQNPAGIHYEKYSTWYLGSNGAIKHQARERVFVADTGNQRIAVYGEDRNSTQIPANAVAWWRFDGSYPDNCGFPFRALVTDALGVNGGGVTSFLLPPSRPGMVRTSIEFLGGDSAVTIADNGSLDFPTSNFTVETWIRADWQQGVASILDKRMSSNLSGYHVFLYDGYLGIQLNPGVATPPNMVPSVPDNFIADGRWHHVALVVDRAAATVTFYRDGVSWIPPQPIGIGAQSIASNASLLIGNRTFSQAGLTGNLDELTIYRRALAGPEIQAIAAAATAGKDFGPVGVLDTNPDDQRWASCNVMQAVP